VWFAGLLAASALYAQTPRDFAVDLAATVSTNTPCISLAWTIRRQGNIVAQKIHRRLKGENVWLMQADLATNQTGYVDNTAVPGVEYEYWMERTYTGIYPTTAMGYLSSGVNVPMADSRGKLLLVVDSTMVAPLAPEIAQLQADLAGDGWLVQTITASRSDTAINTKALIKAAYDADPSNLKMVYLLGHVPVPYSGSIAPDGHGNHVGAWPADGYYGDMDGTWTDTTVNNTSASDTRNRNIPGDGKFDQSSLPGPAELMVGRVDLANMTRAPAPSVSEASLLRRYLRKAHDFRFKLGAYAAIPRRSLVRDGFGYFSGENFAIAGWGWFFSGVGPQVDEPPSGQWFSASYAGGQSYLVGCGNGGGSYTAAGSVGCSEDFGLLTSRVVFTTLFGSYFGDWDSANNFMRAPLAGNATGDSLGLTCFWGGRPNRVNHQMGMGETAGYCMMASHNSAQAGGGSYAPNIYAGVHCGLLGDPALRLHAVEPPRNLSASSAHAQITLAWTASSESNLLGYVIYRAASAAGPFTRLTASPQATTTYTDATVTANQSYAYLVRALKLETSPGGTYQNPSVGSLVTLTANAGGAAAPGNPSSLSVTQNSATNAQLAWVDNASNETGSRIERKTNAGGTYVSVGTVGASVTNFTDPGVFTQGNVYFYRVVATGNPTDSAPSNEASFEAFAGFFDLPATRVKVNKTAGPITITVNRFGGVTGSASVNFATANTSATAGTHYTATNGVLAWADGETGAKTISVPLINTAAPQAARQFKVTLSSPSAGAALTINSSIAVLIEDPAGTLASPWGQATIGGLTDYSPAVLTDGTFGSVSLGGSGLSSGTTTENGRFIYQSRDGDGILTAFFPAGMPSDGNARVALMVRASAANNAIMAAAATSSSTSFGSLLSTRAAAGAAAIVQPASANTLTLARWMRLTRTGSVFTAETSADGSSWTLLGAASLPALPSTALWGLFHFSSDWSVTGLGNYYFAQAQNVTLSDLPFPASPTGLTAAAISPTSLMLTWDTSAYAAGYRIERRDETGTFAQIADMIPGTGTSQTYLDAGVAADTAYAYRISAYNAGGVSAYSTIIYTATPLPYITNLLSADATGAADATVRRDIPDTPLGSQTNLTVAGYDPDTWNLLTNAAKSYLRFNVTDVGTCVFARLKLAFVGASRFEDAAFYRMYIALLSEGSDTWSENSITWNNAPQNSLTSVGFTGTVTWLSYEDRSELPSPGEVVSFDLTASGLNSNRGANHLLTLAISDYSGGALMDWASREHPDYAPPTLELDVVNPAPNRASFFTATLSIGWSVALQWRDNSADETGFEVERSANGGAFALLQTVTSNSVSFTDTTAQPQTTYAYRVRAVSTAGVSSRTPAATVTTPDFFHSGGTLWDAGGADTRIDTPANWDLDLTPLFDGSSYFNFGAGGSVATVNTNVAFLGFNFNRDADFTLAAGGGVLTLGSGGLRAAAPSATPRTYTLDASVALAADQNWGVTNNGAGVTTLVVSGPVSDGASSFGIAKSGNGVLTLAGDSSYDGQTSVASGGVLRVTSANALGSTNGVTSVASNGCIEISGSVAVPEPLTVRDAGANGALRSTDGTNVWAGRVTQAAASRVRALSGSRLALAGGASGAYNLYLSPDAGAEIAVSNAPLNLSSARLLYAHGAGTVTLGAAGSTFGTLEIAGATVKVGCSNALPSAVILALGPASNTSGTFDLNGYDVTVGELKRSVTSPGSRLVTSDTPATLTVNCSGSAAPIFDGTLAGAVSLVKSGSSSSTLNVSGAGNTYSGSTTVSGGTLDVLVAAKLGNSPVVTVTSGTLRMRNANAILDTATLSIADGASARVDSGVETVGSLYLGGSRKGKGTWGSSNSSADFKDNAHFSTSGSGVIYVPSGTSTAWDGGGASDNIDTPNNWDYDNLPAFDGSVALSFGLGGSTASVNTNVSLLSLCFDRDADFTLAAGGGVLTLGSGGLRAAAPSATPRTYTLASGVTLAADQNWGVTNNGAGVTTLVVSGPVSGAYDLTLSPDAGAEIVVSDAPLTLGSARMLRAHGAGTVTLGAAGNTFGTLEIAGATVRIGSTNALPAAAVISIGPASNTGGTFDLDGRDVTVSQLKRGVTAAGNRLVTSSAPATLTVTSDSEYAYDGNLAGALSLTKQGSALWTFSGTNNIYSGSTTVSGGTLDVLAATKLGNSPVVTVTSGTLRLRNANAILDTATLRIADGGATVRVDSGVETVGSLYLGGLRQRRGTYGAKAESGAQYIDAVHFSTSGSGVISVTHGTESVILLK
jgi:autotransporter-associated beta strand protein